MVTHNVQLLSDLFCPQKGPQTLAQFGAGVGSLLAKTPSGCADQYAGSSQQDSPVGDQQSHAKSLGVMWESQITGRPRGKPCGTRAVPPKVVSHFSLSRKVVCPLPSQKEKMPHKESCHTQSCWRPQPPSQHARTGKGIFPKSCSSCREEG